jgi:hypothetical protein
MAGVLSRRGAQEPYQTGGDSCRSTDPPHWTSPCLRGHFPAIRGGELEMRETAQTTWALRGAAFAALRLMLLLSGSSTDWIQSGWLTRSE